MVSLVVPVPDGTTEILPFPVSREDLNRDRLEFEELCDN